MGLAVGHMLETSFFRGPANLKLIVSKVSSFSPLGLIVGICRCIVYLFLVLSLYPIMKLIMAILIKANTFLSLVGFITNTC